MRCFNCKNSWIVKDTKENFSCRYMPQCLMKDVELRESYKTFNIKVGCKVRFKNQKRFWTVIACDERFFIAIRNWKDTYFYTIGDLQECIRGGDNYKGYCDYKNSTQEELDQILKQLHTDCLDVDKVQISYTNWDVLEIEEVK